MSERNREREHVCVFVCVLGCVLSKINEMGGVMIDTKFSFNDLNTCLQLFFDTHTYTHTHTHTHAYNYLFC